MSRFQTDALVPTALNTGILGRKRNADIGGASSSFLNTENQVSAADERDKFAEEWNLRIDKEVKVVAGGLKGLVELANVRLPFTRLSTRWYRVLSLSLAQPCGSC